MGGTNLMLGTIEKKLNPSPPQKNEMEFNFQKIVTQKIFVGEKNVT